MAIGTFYCLWYYEGKEKNIKKNNTNDENAINIFAPGQLNITISIRQLEKKCKLSRRSILHENTT